MSKSSRSAHIRPGTVPALPASTLVASVAGDQEATRPCYSLADAAHAAGIHAQTLRHYERLGLVSPARKGASPQSPRLFSGADIERVARIRRLVEDLGVNPAGAAIILSMRDRIERLLVAQAALEVALARARSEGTNAPANVARIGNSAHDEEHP